MFLVKHRRFGMDKYIFTQTDPRTEGYQGEVVDDNASLDFDLNAVVLWREGEHLPNPQLGRDPRNPKHYKEFKFPEELKAAGYEHVYAGLPFVAYSWSDYRKLFNPVPEEYATKMTQDEWFDFLEEADTAVENPKEHERTHPTQAREQP